jgi:hypothetical protein
MIVLIGSRVAVRNALLQYETRALQTASVSTSRHYTVDRTHQQCPVNAYDL